MIDQRDDRLDPATPYGFTPTEREGWRSMAASAEVASPPLAALTPHECTLIWCILTLLGTHDMPSAGQPIAARSMPTRSAPAPPERHHLTTRETEVLGLVALGLTNAQIAARLFLSRRTIDQHLSSIYNRLGVSSRAAATRVAILNDLC